MEALQYALTMETALDEMFCTLLADAPAEAHSLCDQIGGALQHLKTLVEDGAQKAAQQADLPSVDIDAIMGNKADWQASMTTLGSDCTAVTQTVTRLWAIQTAVMNSGSFYVQASQHDTNAALRFFFRALAEAKFALGRRLEAAVSIGHNQIWEQVGFAPFKMSGIGIVQ